VFKKEYLKNQKQNGRKCFKNAFMKLDEIIKIKIQDNLMQGSTAVVGLVAME